MTVTIRNFDDVEQFADCVIDSLEAIKTLMYYKNRFGYVKEGDCEEIDFQIGHMRERFGSDTE